jgi:hypothetical protein
LNEPIRTAAFQQLTTRLDQSVVKRLEGSLSRVYRGSTVDLRTPFFNERSREDIISLLEERFKISGDTTLTQLREIDTKEKAKCGPMSTPEAFDVWKDRVFSYGKVKWQPNEGSLAYAYQQVAALIRPHSLRPVPLQNAPDYIPKDTSSGLPLLERKGDVAEEYLSRAAQITESSEFYPFVLYVRSTATGLKERSKARPVWGAEMAESLMGATILYPMLNTLRERKGFSPWGGDTTVDLAVDSLLKEYQGDKIISMDFEHFDSSLHSEMMRIIQSLKTLWFTPETADTISILGEFARKGSIVVPFDVWSLRDGGEPSGIVTTNMDDTLANLFAGYYSAHRLGVRLVRFEVLGDDSIYVFRPSVEPEAVSRAIEDLGMSSNPDKVFVSDHSVHFLQRLHTLEYQVEGMCRGIHDPFRTLNGWMSLERFRSGWSKWMYSARAIMQCENVRWDPRFRTFVAFLKEGDDVIRSVDPVEIFRRAGDAPMVRKVLNIASFPFNVQRPERVGEFETTRVLRSLS